MSQEVDFFFAPASRYSYLAATQIGKLERDTGCTVRWRPVHGPDIRKLRGHDPFSGPAVSGQYEWEYRKVDAEAWAAFYGVPFREPRELHFDFELLVRGAVAATEPRRRRRAFCWRLQTRSGDPPGGLSMPGCSSNSPSITD